MLIVLCFTAGKATTDDELEEMLEGGNAAVFTAGVRGSAGPTCMSRVSFNKLKVKLEIHFKK